MSNKVTITIPLTITVSFGQVEFHQEPQQPISEPVKFQPQRRWNASNGRYEYWNVEKKIYEPWPPLHKPTPREEQSIFHPPEGYHWNAEKNRYEYRDVAAEPRAEEPKMDSPISTTHPPEGYHWNAEKNRYEYRDVAEEPKMDSPISTTREERSYRWDADRNCYVDQDGVPRPKLGAEAPKEEVPAEPSREERSYRWDADRNCYVDQDGVPRNYPGFRWNAETNRYVLVTSIQSRAEKSLRWDADRHCYVDQDGVFRTKPPEPDYHWDADRHCYVTQDGVFLPPEGYHWNAEKNSYEYRDVPEEPAKPPEPPRAEEPAHPPKAYYWNPVKECYEFRDLSSDPHQSPSRKAYHWDGEKNCYVDQDGVPTTLEPPGAVDLMGYLKAGVLAAEPSPDLPSPEKIIRRGWDFSLNSEADKAVDLMGYLKAGVLAAEPSPDLPSPEKIIRRGWDFSLNSEADKPVEASVRPAEPSPEGVAIFGQGWIAPPNQVVPPPKDYRWDAEKHCYVDPNGVAVHYIPEKYWFSAIQAATEEKEPKEPESVNEGKEPEPPEVPSTPRSSRNLYLDHQQWKAAVDCQDEAASKGWLVEQEDAAFLAACEAAKATVATIKEAKKASAVEEAVRDGLAAIAAAREVPREVTQSAFLATLEASEAAMASIEEDKAALAAAAKPITEPTFLETLEQEEEAAILASVEASKAAFAAIKADKAAILAEIAAKTIQSVPAEVVGSQNTVPEPESLSQEDEPKDQAKVALSNLREFLVDFVKPLKACCPPEYAPDVQVQIDPPKAYWDAEKQCFVNQTGEEVRVSFQPIEAAKAAMLKIDEVAFRAEIEKGTQEEKEDAAFLAAIEADKAIHAAMAAKEKEDAAIAAKAAILAAIEGNKVDKLIPSVQGDDVDEVHEIKSVPTAQFGSWCRWDNTIGGWVEYTPPREEKPKESNG